MIADLPGTLAAIDRPALRYRRERRVRRALDVDGCVRTNPPSSQAREDVRQDVRAERRVQEDDVERSGRPFEKALGIAHDDFRVRRFEAIERCLQVLRDPRLAIDEGDRSGAARKRLQAERAAAGEEIQTLRTDDRVLQPIEKRFADAIRRRTNRGDRGKIDATASPASADDA